MHEYSIVQALLERVSSEARAHSATTVHKIRVQIGEASGVESDLLQTAFELARTRTICDAAELEIVPVAARWECGVCGAEIQTGEILRCNLCEQPARLVQGDEIILERLEMEAA
jgi:hydrogenase nickel incorporation protein HypA/HybF